MTDSTAGIRRLPRVSPPWMTPQVPWPAVVTRRRAFSLCVKKSRPAANRAAPSRGLTSQELITLRTSLRRPIGSDRVLPACGQRERPIAACWRSGRWTAAETPHEPVSAACEPCERCRRCPSHRCRCGCVTTIRRSGSCSWSCAMPRGRRRGLRTRHQWRRSCRCRMNAAIPGQCREFLRQADARKQLSQSRTGLRPPAARSADAVACSSTNEPELELLRQHWPQG